MSIPKLFITGATGYIGGDFLAHVSKVHPEWTDVTCLVRDSAKGSKLSSKFPHVRVVEGDLDAITLIEEEASKANIVYHFANCDHVASAEAITRGFAKNVNPQAFWIHTSGTGILAHENFAKKVWGYSLPSDQKIYDDWDNISELTSLPDYAIHRHVDKIVLAASKADPEKIKTAILAPPCIYGVGRGPGNTRSIQAYEATEVILSQRRGLKVGDGANIWNEVHVHDLSVAYMLLGEAAANGGAPATWNESGYYLAENGDFVWGDILQAITDEAHKQGFLSSNAIETVTFEEGAAINGRFPYLIGSTSRGTSIRARKLLGWKPVEKRLKDEIPGMVAQEAKLLGLKRAD